LTDNDRKKALIMLWASMTSLQLTTDPTMSIQIMQDCIEEFGNDIVQTLTSELLIADETSSHDIKVVKCGLTFSLFNEMDAWMSKVN
jgi:acetone carboxylase gamma subunit